MEQFRDTCGFLKNGSVGLWSWQSFTILRYKVMFGRKEKPKKEDCILQLHTVRIGPEQGLSGQED